jgi:hypothetical protein
MALRHIEQCIGHGAAKDGNIRQRNGVPGRKLQHENVNGHEHAAAANAAAGLVWERDSMVGKRNREQREEIATATTTTK